MPAGASSPSPSWSPASGSISVVRHFDGTNDPARRSRPASPARPSQHIPHRAAADPRRRPRPRPRPGQPHLGQLPRRLPTPARSARRPTPARSYAGDRARLRAQLARYFADPEGVGHRPPSRGRDAGRPRSAASSARTSTSAAAGPSYTWAYKELVERSDADVFVILGVAHSALPAPVRPDPQGLRDPARPGADRPGLRRRASPRSAGPSPLRRRAGPPHASTRSSSRSSSSSTCWAAVATSRSCRSSSARSTT